MNVNVSTNAVISFTEEEANVLKMAMIILKETGIKLWDNENSEDIACLFADTAESISDILDENY